jgi:hypothetical protein
MLQIDKTLNSTVPSTQRLCQCLSLISSHLASCDQLASRDAICGGYTRDIALRKEGGERVRDRERLRDRGEDEQIT